MVGLQHDSLTARQSLADGFRNVADVGGGAYADGLLPIGELKAETHRGAAVVGGLKGGDGDLPHLGGEGGLFVQPEALAQSLGLGGTVAQSGLEEHMDGLWVLFGQHLQSGHVVVVVVGDKDSVDAVHLHPDMLQGADQGAGALPRVDEDAGGGCLQVGGVSARAGVQGTEAVVGHKRFTP